MFANLIVGLGLGSSRDVGISDRWRREINPLLTWLSLFSLVSRPSENFCVVRRPRKNREKEITQEQGKGDHARTGKRRSQKKRKSSLSKIFAEKKPIPVKLYCFHL